MLFRSANGDRYQGEWLDNQSSGWGLQIWANGDRYEGEWLNDMAHGQGTKTTADGRSYTGTWNNGCLREGERWSTAGATREQCGF